MFCSIASKENYSSLFIEHQHHSLIANGDLDWGQRCDIAAIAFVYSRAILNLTITIVSLQGEHLKNSWTNVTVSWESTNSCFQRETENFLLRFV